MRVLAIVQEADAGPGVFAEAIAARGAALECWTQAEGGPPPADPLGYDAVLSLGGSMNVDQEDAHPWLGDQKALLRELLAAGVPLLGLCLGAQLLAEAAGANPRRASRPEIGWHAVELTEAGTADPLLAPLAPRFEAFQWHSYEFPLPQGALALARSEVCLQAARLAPRAYAIQFHPEVSRRDALTWIDDYRVDPDAVRIGIDPVALRAETEAKIDSFNQLGRDLCGRWLDLAA
ncbi:MAG: type 1 glutamine amidotransferase [Solirubrobacterales bacterium]